MKIPLVECIPNFSEARRPEVITAIVSAINDVKGISILDTSSDTDHNRTVITFVGSPQSVEEAAYVSIRKAAELIDLENHTGSHPRIGATDVVPFVPISGIDMTECIHMAKHLGERVGRELGIPVYLYENAATRPDHVYLEDIRRGQFEGLKEEIKSNPDRSPDYGPSNLGPAGATVIGARHPLIAFNVYLSTTDTVIAKEIAKSIRHSSGGFRYVKSLGMLVDGRAQVSMNLTNFHKTPIQRVVETIRREADRFGVSIHHCEIVGLIPGEALMQAAAWYMQIQDFDPDQVLETRLMEIRTEGQPELNFLDSLASRDPTPGGGSAAAFSGAMGAALVAMVARLTLGKKKYSQVENQMEEILTDAEKSRSEFSSAVAEDAAAFEAILHALKLPKETDEEQVIRQNAIQAATLLAAQVPLMTAGKAVNVMSLAERCAALGNINAISDAASAFATLQASVKCAGYNVRININNLADKEPGIPLLEQMNKLEESARKLEQMINQHLQERGGFQI